MQTLIRFFLTLCLTMCTTAYGAADDGHRDEHTEETEPLDDSSYFVSEQLDNFYREIYAYRDIVPTLREQQLGLLGKRLKMTETRFTTFTTNYQEVIDASEDTSEQHESIVALLHEILTAIDTQTANLQKARALDKAEQYIPTKVAVFKTMHQKAMQYMMVKQMGARLEKLKQEEAVVKADVDAVFKEAHAAANDNPALKQRMARVEEAYYVICSYSEEIQGAAYKPLVARIKDYLLSLAAVAIILMFFNMAIAKSKAAKAAKKAALEAQKALGRQNDYPKI